MTRTGFPLNPGGPQASGMIGSVVAGFGGSPQSSVAAYWAAREAGLRAVPLRLIHVQEPSALGHVFRALDSRSRCSAQHLLAQTAEELRRTFPALDISIRSVDGRPIDVLSESAADSDMIVLGSRALGPVMGFVLGSVSMALIGATNCPTVSVRAKDDASYGDLVVGVDVRQPCEALLRFAFDEAEQRGCGIRFLSAWALPPLVGYGAAYDPRVHVQLDGRPCAATGIAAPAARSVSGACTAPGAWPVRHSTSSRTSNRTASGQLPAVRGRASSTDRRCPLPR